MLTFKQYFLLENNHKKEKEKKDKIPCGIVIHDKKYIEKLRQHKIDIQKKKNINEKKGEGEEQLEKLHQELLTKESHGPDEKKAIKAYSDKSFELNALLLGHHHVGVETNPQLSLNNGRHNYNLNHLDRATNKPIGKSVTVFSGLGFDPRKQVKNKRIHFPAYTSSSIDKQAANSFAIRQDDNKKHMLRINLTPRDHGAYIGTPSGYINERELLLPRNTTMRIHRSIPDENDPSLIIHHASIEHDVPDHEIERNPNLIRNLHRNFHEVYLNELNAHPKLKALVPTIHKINSKSTPEELHEMRNDPDEEVRRLVASHGNTSLETLHEMRNDPDDEVRRGIAWNSNTSSETLHGMRNDLDKKVRRDIAWNRNTSLETLHEMRNDPDDEVRRGIAWHSNTSSETLHEMRNDLEDGVRQGIVNHRNTSLETLHGMRNDPNTRVRQGIANHRNTSLETLQHLSNDKRPEVRKIAINRLKELKK